MKKFVFKVVVFLFFFKLFDGLLFSFFSWVRYDISLDRDYGSLNRMYSGLINADIVAFGSSRTYLHLNPEVIQNVTGETTWNLGMDGSNFDQHYFTLKEYLLHNRIPKIVIFESDLMSLDPTLLRFKTDLFLPYRGYSTHTFELFSSSMEDLASYWLVSSLIYKQEIPQMISDPANILKRIGEQGFSYKTPGVSSEIEKVDRGEYFLINGAEIKMGQISDALPNTLPFPSPRINFDFSKTKDREKAFEELSQLAEEKGIILVFLMSPYLDGEIDESQRKIAIDFYSSLSERYPGVYFLDYSNHASFSNNLDLWWNVGHLNYEGANLLSEQIGQSLNQIIAKEK